MVYAYVYMRSSTQMINKMNKKGTKFLCRLFEAKIKITGKNMRTCNTF